MFQHENYSGFCIDRRRPLVLENVGRWVNVKVAFALLFFASATYGQTQISINVSDRRPLAKAAEQVEQSLRVPINYEDVPYEANVADVTERVMSPNARAANPNARVIVPRGGPLALSIQVAGTDKMTDGVTALSAVLGAYETAGYTDRYKVEPANGMFYVVPERVLKSTGTLSDVGSVLSSRISLPYQDRTAAETLQLILSNASAASGFKIGIGMVPLNTLLSQRASIGANNQPARDVLSLLFGSVSNANSPMLAYQLYFDPRLKYYMFNAHEVASSTTFTPTATQTNSISSGANVHFTRAPSKKQ